ncbi:hypothetical protein ACE1CI_33815 [Aerosakkonemataceae cyanobacterium BLCC-F50]|uniref:Uncharacterized protein n=1 Tax=Floridaenema flaviceps BLCC-F50 TaxID=3153642 RepID=A0ABV4Y375_9CYAN
MTGIEHLIKYGIDEGRTSSLGFDVRYYLEHNADLKAAGLNYQQAFQHFIMYGLQEGRVRVRSCVVIDVGAIGLVQMESAFVCGDRCGCDRTCSNGACFVTLNQWQKPGLSYQLETQILQATNPPYNVKIPREQ